jgi:alkanesulfonate monooxygenase SsuD/methylene tetrahydromethanopterin reductase-like flavin-dependent oxidoreductase (luciferase family)
VDWPGRQPEAALERRLGVAVVPLENRREALLATAEAAERRGYDAFYQNETWAYDATVLLAAVALRTRRLGLGTGILGVWGRSAGTLAMAATTLAALSGGRFALGLGASSPQLTEGLHDVPFAEPLARLRRTVTQVRALLRGERIPLAVATGARALKLNAPATEVPIYLGALADESIRLAGELGDGWLPFLYPRDRLAAGRERLAEGAARRDGPARPLAVLPTVPTVVADSEARARSGAAWFAAFYITSMGALYRASLVRQGYGAEVEAIVAANTPKLAGTVPASADRLLEQLAVWGTPEGARARLETWYAAGADMPVIFIRSGLPAEEMEQTLDAFRPAAARTGVHPGDRHDR